MPRRSSSPERKPSTSVAPAAPSGAPGPFDGSDFEAQPQPARGAQAGQAKRGRIDAAARAALAAAVVQRGVAAALADISAVSAEVSFEKLEDR